MTQFDLSFRSKLAFGGGPLGNLMEAVSDDDARAAVYAALAVGITHFDTAPHYGRGLSERRLGDVLRGQSDVIVSSKVGRLMRPDASFGDDRMRDGFRSPMPFRPEYDYSGDGILRSHESSLQRLGLGRIDTLLVHDIGEMNHGADNAQYWAQLTDGGGFKALEQLRDDGTIAGFGLGVNEVAVCLDAMRHVRLDTILLAGRYTLLDQAALDGLFDACLASGTRVMLGAPFNSGVLVSGTKGSSTIWYDYAPASPDIVARTQRIEAIAERYEVPLPAAALQFPLGHPAVERVVAGFRSADQVNQAAAWMGWSIPADFWAELKKEGLLRADAPTPDGAA